MRYHHLGKTELQVSVIGFDGTFGGRGPFADRLAERDVRRQALDALHSAVRAGINYFDCGNDEGDGRFTDLLGEGAEGVRSKVFLAAGYDFRRMPTLHEQRTELLLATLDRLRTNHVDVLQFHAAVWDDDLAARLIGSGLLDWADEMHRRGYYRYAGVSAETPSTGLQQLVRTDRFDLLRLRHSAFFPGNDQQPAAVIPFALSMGVGVVATCDPGAAQSALSDAVYTPEVHCTVLEMTTPEEVWACAEMASDVTRLLDVARPPGRAES